MTAPRDGDARSTSDPSRPGWPSTTVRYVARRLVTAVLLAFAAASCAMVAVSLAPGDATMALRQPGVSEETITRERARLGLDRGLGARYADWVGRLMRLDLGESSRFRRPVAGLVGERMRYTALLATSSLVVATGLGLWLGIVSGSGRHPRLAAVVGGCSVVAVSIPSLLASLLLAFVAARTGWFPVGGVSSPDLAGAGWWPRAIDVAWHLVLPTLALALPIVGTLERLQSRAVGEAVGAVSVRAAVARGVPRRRVLWHHVVPLAIRPVLGIYGIVIGSLFSGSLAVEIVTAWPGIGQLMYDGLVARDVSLVAGCALAGAACLAAGTFVSDVALFVADPRLRES